MYEFIDGSMMVQFLLVFAVIVVTFAGFIVWFMDHEETKAFNYYSVRYKKASEELDAAYISIKALIDVKDKKINRIVELKEANNVIHDRVNQQSLDFEDHLDNIAETLGKKVTLKSWRQKTVIAKIAAILKKIEQLKKNKGYL